MVYIATARSHQGISNIYNYFIDWVIGTVQLEVILIINAPRLRENDCHVQDDILNLQKIVVFYSNVIRFFLISNKIALVDLMALDGAVYWRIYV